MTERRRTLHVRIEGRVQGVGYRAWTQRTAAALGLDGWVRNRRDGTVEAVFQGASGDIEAVLVRCEAGPPHAEVTRIEVVSDTMEVASDGFAGFEVRPTA